VPALEDPYLLSYLLSVKVIDFVERLEAVGSVLTTEKGTLVTDALLACLTVNTQFLVLV